MGRDAGDDPACVLLRADAELGAGPRRVAHARRDARAVAEGKAVAGLDGMADGVAEVEGLSKTPLALVGIDHVALDLDVSRDDARKLVGGVVFGVDWVLLELAEQLRVCEHAMLDDLAARVGEQLMVDGLEGVGVCDDDLGLPEGAREVLAGREVDGGLSAHG